MFLLDQPTKGITLLQETRAAIREAVKNNFWADEGFRNRWWQGVKSVDDLMDNYLILGFNYPPSQYHLHLQAVFLPWLPFHQDLLHEAKHCHWHRFFNYDFAIASLRACEKTPFALLPMKEDTDIMDIIAELKKTQGVDYEKMHTEFLNKAHLGIQKLESYKAEDFDYIVLSSEKDQKIVLKADTMEKAPEQDTKKIQAADTDVLQNYGRPYDANGKHSGTYYSMAITLKEFAERKWFEMV